MLALGGIGLHLVLGRLFPDPLQTVLGNIDATPVFLVLNGIVSLITGVALVWLYAASRFRLRSTLRTSLRVALAVWCVSYLPVTWALRALDVLPRPITLTIAGWGLIVLILAAVAGGFVHQLTKPDDARY